MKAAPRGGIVAAILLASACAAMTTAQPVETDAIQPVRMEARSVPLGPGGATLAPGVRYAGGLSLHGASLHGLSDLKLAADGSGAWTVSDFGSLIRFDIRTDAQGRLIGADSAIRRPLTGLDGEPLGAGKGGADAEGLALLDDGRMLVSFERDDRIWSYGRDGAETPVSVRHPDAAFPGNEGMEGLAAAPDQDGRPAWLVLGEAGGAWTCTAIGCHALPAAPTRIDDGFMFTSADRDPSGGWFVLERYYRPPLTLRARVRRMAPDGTLGPPLITLRPPASVDNFEGIAVRATPGGVRLYILSDDNAFFLEKTLLLAFDVAR